MRRGDFMKKKMKRCLVGLLILSMLAGYALNGNYMMSSTEVKAASGEKAAKSNVDAVSYTVITTSAGGQCLYIFNKTANSGPVTMTYTVDSFANVNTPDRRTGVVASANPFSSSQGRQYPYLYSTAGSSKHTDDPNFMMQVGYTYSITMNLDASNMITYSGR